MSKLFDVHVKELAGNTEYGKRKIRTAKIDRKQVNDELNNLHSSKVFLPLRYRRWSGQRKGAKSNDWTNPNFTTTGCGIVVIV